MKKIIVSVSNDLITDQRVHKVCSSLHNNGYSVLLMGCLKSKRKELLTRTYQTKRFKVFFTNGFLFYAEFNVRLFFLLLFSKKDILLSNDVDSLLPNYLISRFQSKKLVFDSHELFSEIPELVDRKLVKNIWLFLEKKIIPNLKNAYTVCESIANHYRENYNTHFKILRNVPFTRSVEKKELQFSTDKKIIIYQGAVNLGRGLELMIDTMKYLEDYIFLIVGKGDILQSLQDKVKKENLVDKVLFYGKVTPSELKQITPNAVLGISMEEDLGLNYRYALPNKIFDYIQAEIPVLCSDLPEMKRIVKDYGVGEVIIDRTPKMIAKQIQQMEEKDYHEQLLKAKQELIWENEESVLLELFDNLK
ncbi:glycosyltransferase [Tenacibaculum agarivorans]|uniref:glycosyltransferase n=1 Tax=Tenacibaculum agarivorans TaxID=1908389 RepID=UPI00094BBD3C|nr:glycosyltransferase [Tenacibaculum agarivorans]